VIEESSRFKNTARDQVRLEKQRRLAETLRLRADAEERGEDVERRKNWEWTIEENEEWEKKLARKARRADFEFHGMVAFRFTCRRSAFIGLSR
jgi:pre-mRNA-splicing factor SYF2